MADTLPEEQNESKKIWTPSLIITGFGMLTAVLGRVAIDIIGSWQIPAIEQYNENATGLEALFTSYGAARFFGYLSWIGMGLFMVGMILMALENRRRYREESPPTD